MEEQKRCKVCNGTGKMPSRRKPIGNTGPCLRCGGTGEEPDICQVHNQFIRDVCPECEAEKVDSILDQSKEIV